MVTFKSVDFEESRVPFPMWVGLMQSGEGFTRKRLPLKKRKF